MYSYYNIVQRINDIGAMLDKASEDNKFSTKLVYGLRKNQSKARNELRIFEEDLPTNVEGWDEYQKERTETIKKCGGKFEQKGRQTILVPDSVDEAKFEKEIKKVNEKFEEVLEKQKEMLMQEHEKKQEEVIDIDWHKVKLEWFPDTITGKDMPESIIELIEE